MTNPRPNPPQPACPQCGGLHFGSTGCPYAETVCDVCHKTLLQHPGYHFCEGSKTEYLTGAASVANTPQPDLEERQKFEAWWISDRHDKHSLDWISEEYLEQNALGGVPRYNSARARLAFTAWLAARRLSPDPMQSYENKLLADAQRRGMEIAECGHATKYETIGIPGGVGCLLCDIDRLRAALKTQEPAPKEMK